jgi:hypothetical protein
MTSEVMDGVLRPLDTDPDESIRMKRRIGAVLVACACVGLVFAQLPNAYFKGPRVDDTVKQLEQYYGNSIHAADTGKLNQILAGDWTNLGQTGEILTKQSFLSDLKSGKLRHRQHASRVHSLNRKLSTPCEQCPLYPSHSSCAAALSKSGLTCNESALGCSVRSSPGAFPALRLALPNRLRGDPNTADGQKRHASSKTSGPPGSTSGLPIIRAIAEYR